MIAVVLLALLQANAAAPPSNPVAKLSQAKLDAMSDACHAPRAWLKQLAGERVRFQPSPDGKYAMVDCVLNQLRKSSYPMKLGFIGNEAYTDDGHH